MNELNKIGENGVVVICKIEKSYYYQKGQWSQLVILKNAQIPWYKPLIFHSKLIFQIKFEGSQTSSNYTKLAIISKEVFHKAWILMSSQAPVAIGMNLLANNWLQRFGSGGEFSSRSDGSELDLAVMVSDFFEIGSAGADSWCSSDSDSGLSDLAYLTDRISVSSVFYGLLIVNYLFVCYGARGLCVVIMRYWLWKRFGLDEYGELDDCFYFKCEMELVPLLAKVLADAKLILDSSLQLEFEFILQYTEVSKHNSG